MNRPTHFEIQADNPERAIGFYEKLFGWEFTKWDGPMPYWLIKTGEGEPGIDGGLLPRMGGVLTPGAAVNAYVCTMMVTNVDTMLSTAVSLGGAVALPKMPVPGMGWLAYARDTEENIFGMMQADPSAV